MARYRCNPSHNCCRRGSCGWLCERYEEVVRALCTRRGGLTRTEFTIDASYAADLRRKRDVFRQVTGSRNALLLTPVTTYGVAENRHSRELGVGALAIDALFGAG